VELCQLLALRKRATRVGTRPLSRAFAARLCLWCKVIGTHQEENAQKHKTAEKREG